MANPVEAWKSEKHGFDVWPDVLQYAQARTPMQDIETPDLERMKWYGAFYRKRDASWDWSIFAFPATFAACCLGRPSPAFTFSRTLAETSRC